MKTSDLITGLGLITAGLLGYFYFTKNSKKTASGVPNSGTASSGSKLEEVVSSIANTAVEGAKSQIADIPVNTPISGSSTVTTPVVSTQQLQDNLVKAKELSAKISADNWNLSRYKKASSRANVQAEIDKNTALLKELGYTALPDGGVKLIQ